MEAKDKLKEKIFHILNEATDKNYRIKKGIALVDITDKILVLFEEDGYVKIEGILEIITEDFVEMVANLYMNKENRKRTFELWQSVKKHALVRE